jgi:hypothetical protein
MIPVQQARQILTQTFLGAWKESLPVTNFFRSFFETKVSTTQFVSIEVQRGTRKIAVDVIRGNEGNKNSFGLSTAKIFLPPYYAENFNNTSLALYDQIAGFSGTEIEPQILANSVAEIAENYEQLKNKIERSYELQAAQVLQTGQVTTKTLDVIDYKAKGTHIVTLDTKWDATTPLILKGLAAQFDILKRDGAASTIFNVICGSQALYQLTNSAEFSKNYGLFQQTIAQYNMPRLQATTGAVLINVIPIGPYIANIWSYNETYTNAAGISTEYLDPKKVVIVAESFKGFMSFAAVPRVLTDNGILQNANFSQSLDNGAYLLNNYVKPEVSSHVFEIKSAGLAVPLSIDHFSCLTVLN